MNARAMPAPEDLRFAAEWLREYDDSHDGGAQTAVAERVAAWLDVQADAKESRDAARAHGVPVTALRAAVAKAAAADTQVTTGAAPTSSSCSPGGNA